MSNPNGLGILMVWCVLCALLFWDGSETIKLQLKRLLVLTLIPVATYVLPGNRIPQVSGGSRCNAVGVGSLRPSSGAGLPGVVTSIVGLIAGGVLVSLGPVLVADTTVGRRIDEFYAKGGGSLKTPCSEHSLRDVYGRSEDFHREPCFWRGMNNFQDHFYMATYSHSDLIEPLDDGLPGFILYQSFYVLLIVRARRLLRVVQDGHDHYRLRIVLIGVLAIMVIGLGAPHYTRLSSVLDAHGVFGLHLTDVWRRVEAEGKARIAARVSSPGERSGICRGACRRGLRRNLLSAGSPS